jgi:hypothetical protein
MALLNPANSIDAATLSMLSPLTNVRNTCFRSTPTTSPTVSGSSAAA